MEMFATQRIRTLAQFIDALALVRTKQILWFRGQSRARYRLIPSLAREPGAWLTRELPLYKRFQQNASALLPATTRTEWDWLLLMQHYGVPTRLLDWSENPLAALYFAVNSKDGVDVRYDGVFWVLDPIGLNVASNIILPANDIPILDADPILNQYKPVEVANSVAPQGPAAVLAKRQFPRLVAQAGVFTVIHKDRTRLDQIRGGDLVGRFVIPRGAKKALAKELQDVGVTRLTLFPELESVAEVASAYLR